MSAQVKKEANKVSAILSSYMIYLVLIIMVIAISVLSGGKFLRITNILNVLRQVTITGTLAIGMTLVLITGGIDLSVGSVMAIAGVVAADLAHANGESRWVFRSWPAGNWTAVWCGKWSPHCLHKGTGFYRNSWYAICIKRNCIYLHARLTDYQSFGCISVHWKGTILESRFGLYFCTIYYFNVYILHYSKMGRYIYAIGNNEAAAIASGVKTKLVKLYVYCSCGALAGFTGLLLASRNEFGSTKCCNRI